MAIYLVLLTKDSPSPRDRIKEQFPDAHYEIEDKQWLVVSDQTAKGVSNLLAPEDNRSSLGSHMVVQFDNYWGWHEEDVWNWAKVKRGDE